MNVVLFLPLLVCLLGALIYARTVESKTAEMGRLAFACGLLITLFELATRVIQF